MRLSELPENKHLTSVATGLKKGSWSGDPVWVDPASHFEIRDLGWLHCPCSVDREPCEHLYRYIWLEKDADLLQRVEAIRENSGQDIRDFEVWVPFMLNSSAVLTDINVSFVREDDAWLAEIKPFYGFEPLGDLGFVGCMNFSRRRLARRAYDSLLWLSLRRCSTCEYEPSDKTNPVLRDSDDRRYLLKRGAIMATTGECELCRDMTEGIKDIGRRRA